jgi:hypothetical protein
VRACSWATEGTFQVNARAVPLADVEQAWGQPSNGERIVITPQPAPVST